MQKRHFVSLRSASRDAFAVCCLNHVLHTRRIYEAAQRKLSYQIKAVTVLILKSLKLHKFLCLLQEGSGALGRGRRTTVKIRWRSVAVSTDIIENLSKSATAVKTIAQNNIGEKRTVKMLRKDDFRQRREGSKSYQQISWCMYLRFKEGV